MKKFHFWLPVIEFVLVAALPTSRPEATPPPFRSCTLSVPSRCSSRSARSMRFSKRFSW